MPVSVLKRISKLLDFKKKRRFSFFVFFLSILKRKQLEANAVTSNHPPNPDPTGRGKKLSGQERRKERSKEKWWMRDRDTFGNWNYFIFICLWIVIINFFLLFNLCGFFFVIFFFFCYTLPCFFVNFGGLSLPCHLLCCLLLFVYFYLFIYLLFFLPSWIFWVFFCKFNCSWYFFTSSDRVPPGGFVAQGPRFEGRYRRVVSYTIDDWGKRVAWLTRIDGHGTEETVDDGLGGRCLG